MTKVLTFSDGDKFIFRVYSDLGATGGTRWSNTFEAFAHANGTLTDLQTLGGKLALFTQAMSGSQVRITDWSVGTWVADSTPYDPESFYISPALNLEGSRTINDPLDLDVCLDLRRSVAVGRAGNIYYRGALGEEDVAREGGKFILENPIVMAGYVSAAVTATNLNYYYLGGAMVPLWLGLIGQNIVGTVHQRAITNIAVRGVTIVPMNHRWYNQPNRSALSVARRAARVNAKLARASELLKG